MLIRPYDPRGLCEPYNFTGMVVSAQAAISGPFYPPTRPGNEASLLS